MLFKCILLKAVHTLQFPSDAFEILPLSGKMPVRNAIYPRLILTLIMNLTVSDAF